MTTTISVLLVDDHAVVREGYRRLIEKHPDIVVVAEAEDAASGYQAFKKHRPDVAVVDISMPGRGGIDLVRQIREEGFDPAHVRHARDFNLRHPDAFQTLTPEEDQRITRAAP